MFRKISAVIVGMVLALGLASSAAAYPADEDATVSNPTVAPGQPFNFFAEGFLADSTVTITATLVDAQAAGSLDVVASGGSRMGAGFVVVRTSSGVVETHTQDADGDGKITQALTLSTPGDYEIVASGTGADGNPLSVRASVLVSTDAAGSDNGSDSDTGSDSSGSGSASGSNDSSSSAAGKLARTGIDNAATIAWAGFGVLVLGGLLVAVASGRGRVRQTV